MANELEWVKILKDNLGLQENTSKKAHNATILKWLKTMGKYSKESKAWWAEDETPWCGLAVGYALGESGRYVIKNWFRAKAWADTAYMTKLSKPAYGCIAVKSRQGGGHVFFVVGKDKSGKILGLGGNQGNKISVMPFNESELSFFWPSKWNGSTFVKSSPDDSRYNLSKTTVVATVAQGSSEA